MLHVVERNLRGIIFFKDYLLHGNVLWVLHQGPGRPASALFERSRAEIFMDGGSVPGSVISVYREGRN